jgi:hypothetical protein
MTNRTFGIACDSLLMNHGDWIWKRPVRSGPNGQPVERSHLVLVVAVLFILGKVASGAGDELAEVFQVDEMVGFAAQVV